MACGCMKNQFNRRRAAATLRGTVRRAAVQRPAVSGGARRVAKGPWQRTRTV